MKTLVISLPTAHERRRRMGAILNDRQINFDFVDGVIATSITPKDTAFLRLPNNMSKPEIGCLLAHIRAWELASTSAERTLILEDDVHFSHDFSKILNELSCWDYPGKIIKLETMYGVLNVSIPAIAKYEQYSFYEMRSMHVGAAAYVLDQESANQLLAKISEIRFAVDLEIFGNDGIGKDISRLQIIPGCVIQDQLLPSKMRFGLGSSIRTLEDKKSYGFLFKKKIGSILGGHIIFIIKNAVLYIYSALALPRKVRRIFVGYSNS